MGMFTKKTLKRFLRLIIPGINATGAKKSACYDRSKDPHPFTLFMQDSGWCWYQDPRAIIHRDKVLIGAIEGSGRGSAVIGVYDLKVKNILGRSVIHENYDWDDHNSPVLHELDNGRVLTFYARHNKDKIHKYRISESEDLLTWSKEKEYEHNYPDACPITYMNLLELKKEGKIYNFFRGIKRNPSYIVSTDNGETWGDPTHLIASKLLRHNKHHRPYARYISNGLDTVHISFTDGHPRNFGNNLYYVRFRKNGFYRANDKLIKTLKTHGALQPDEADKIYQGGKGKFRGKCLSVFNSAWTSSIALDEKESPHIGYSVYLSNTDHRYRLAFWDGEKWIDREVAYAGKCLYDKESSYTGLITLCPRDPSYVVISTDVDPSTGKDLGGNHEIFRATVGPNDDINNIYWEAITQNSPVLNIRPVILKSIDRRIILWQRGDFRSYKDFQMDTVGIVEEM